MRVICPYCRKPARKVLADEAFPNRKDLRGQKFWACLECDARVACHQDGRPMGLLANGPVRKARHEAHKAFDPLWQDIERAGYPPGMDKANAVRVRNMMRQRCYAWLADILQMSPEEAHIGMITDVPLLNAIAEMCRDANPARLRERYAGVESDTLHRHKRQSRTGRRRNAA